MFQYSVSTVDDTRSRPKTHRVVASLQAVSFMEIFWLKIDDSYKTFYEFPASIDRRSSLGPAFMVIRSLSSSAFWQPLPF